MNAWDNEWIKRTRSDGTISRNAPKAKYLCKKLWDRAYLINMWKLEIGCGEGIHIRSLARHCDAWKENYLGIDISKYAVEKAQQYGIRAEVEDFLTFDTDLRFNLFLFLDSYEHIDDWRAVAAKVRELARDEIVIIGNVPMAPGERDEEISDRQITLNEICDFILACGCNSINHEIYGARGLPFLFFEATNHK